jgi:hypothetical protein
MAQAWLGQTINIPSSRSGILHNPRSPGWQMPCSSSGHRGMSFASQVIAIDQATIINDQARANKHDQAGVKSPEGDLCHLQLFVDSQVAAVHFHPTLSSRLRELRPLLQEALPQLLHLAPRLRVERRQPRRVVDYDVVL